MTDLLGPSAAMRDSRDWRVIRAMVTEAIQLIDATLESYPRVRHSRFSPTAPPRKPKRHVVRNRR